MKKLFTSICFMTLLFLSAHAQDADAIVQNYLEVIGGTELLKGVGSSKAIGVAVQGGMEFPFEATNAEGGKMKVDISFQGQTLTVQCFDGNEGWGVNFMTMAAEKWDKEQSDFTKSNIDFPEPFLNYRNKGYSLNYEGEETIDGVDCHKIKLIKNPFIVDGVKKEVFSYFYFDKDSGVPIMSETASPIGQMKGIPMQTLYSDYEELDNGLVIPMNVTQKANGQVVAEMKFTSFEYNIEIADGLFDFPEEAPAAPTGGQ